MWRPDDWDSPYPSKPSFVAQREAFEAGADAMLEALPRMELGNIYNVLVVDVLAAAMIEYNVKAGYLIFIPSEED